MSFSIKYKCKKQRDRQLDMKYFWIIYYCGYLNFIYFVFVYDFILLGVDKLENIGSFFLFVLDNLWLDENFY